MGLLAAVLLALALSPPSPPFTPATGGGETTVRGERPVDIDDERAPVGDALLLADPADVLLGVLGGGLVHDGGPLAPARLVVRGLSGARLHADLSGLDLTDPATGLVDVAALPWTFTESLVLESGADGRGTGGGLRLTPSRIEGIRGHVLAGSLGTVRGSLVAASDELLVAADAGTTRGDFLFVPTSATGGPAGEPLLRGNNDQRRASALALGRMRTGDVEMKSLAFAAGHTGGIPGLATSPTRLLRGEDGVAGARVSVERKTALVRTALALDGRASHRSTEGPADPRSVIESLGGRISVDVRALPLALPWTDASGFLDVGAGADTARLMDGSFSRSSASMGVATRLPLDASPSGWRLRASVDARALTDAGLLAGGELRVEAGDLLRASLGLARSARAPTLDELYAPRGLVLGNPALRPEVIDDVEAAFAFVPGRLVEVRTVAFGGLIEEGIAWVNKNAYEVAPVNLGRAWRAGIDASMNLEPVSFVGVSLVATTLWSLVEETGEPLPLAPPFSSRIAVRLGSTDGAYVTTSVRSRGAAASNLYGTLVAPAYSLVDVVARVPVDEHLDLGVALTNVFDVLDARDANQLPLPGRLIFFSLEVRG